MNTSIKECFKCGAEKPLADFYKHRGMADGRLNKCKSCAREDARENRQRNIERIREYDRNRGSRATSEYLQKYKTMFPAKKKAHTAIGNAVRDGRLTKQPCEVCGATENIHAHHDDYLKPLDVRWMCAAHHHQWHSQHGEARNGDIRV